MPIKAILESLYSKRDRNGNTYWAFRWTDVITGTKVVGTVSGGESNISCIVREMGLDWESCHYTLTEMPIREFNRLTKEWKYAGCPPAELAKYIRDAIAHPDSAVHPGVSCTSKSA